MTYYKTKEVIEKMAKDYDLAGFIAQKTTLNCACGESPGFNIISNDYLTSVDKLILCESCFNNTPFSLRGE